MDYREKRREQKPNPRNTWLVVESDRVGQVNKRLGRGTCALLMLKEMCTKRADSCESISEN